MHSIAIIGDRPDYRVFIDLLFGAGHDVAPDGDSRPVHSRRWTFLYLADRSGDRAVVRIRALAGEPLGFGVESTSERLEQLAAVYLCDYCGSGLSTPAGPVAASELARLRRGFEHELARAAASIWHRSCDEVPYPNLATRS